MHLRKTTEDSNKCIPILLHFKASLTNFKNFSPAKRLQFHIFMKQNLPCLL